MLGSVECQIFTSPYSPFDTRMDSCLVWRRVYHPYTVDATQDKEILQYCKFQLEQDSDKYLPVDIYLNALQECIPKIPMKALRSWEKTCRPLTDLNLGFDLDLDDETESHLVGNRLGWEAFSNIQKELDDISGNLGREKVELFGKPKSQQYPRRFWHPLATNPARMHPFISWYDDNNDITNQLHFPLDGPLQKFWGKKDSSGS